MLVKHPDWCEETECSVPEGAGVGTHVSQKVWVNGRGGEGTAVFVEHRTDATTWPRIVVTSINVAREGGCPSWDVGGFRDVLAVFDKVLAQRGPEPPDNRGRPC